MIIPLSKKYKSRHGLPLAVYVDSEIFTRSYPETSCLDMGCKDVCCSGGAFMDIVTFKKLKKHRKHELFKDLPWDTYKFEPDPCYPGGKGCYTIFENNRCIFQVENGNGCRIHAYCLQKGIDFRELKFFACCFFPVEINKVGEFRNVLTAGYELRHDEFKVPCKISGTSTVYEIAKNDILYYYGPGLVKELEEIKGKVSGEKQILL